MTTPACCSTSNYRSNSRPRSNGVYDVSPLEQAILGQGWMPIDAMVVWTYPTDPGRHIVVEGNTRTVTLRRLRDRLPKEQAKLARMRDGKRYSADTIAEQERLDYRPEGHRRCH